MSRGASPGRSTPYIDRWKKDTTRALTNRGARTRLAEWLADLYGSTIEIQKIQIARILNTAQIPDGEFVLAVQAWLQKNK